MWNLLGVLVLIAVFVADWTHTRVKGCEPLSWRTWVSILLHTGEYWIAIAAGYWLYVVVFAKDMGWWAGHQEAVLAVFIGGGLALIAGLLNRVTAEVRSWWRFQDGLLHAERLIVLHDNNGVQVLFDPKYSAMMTEQSTEPMSAWLATRGKQHTETVGREEVL